MDTPETAAPGDKVIFMDDMESLKADVQELTDAGVTKILALTHEGYKRDQEIAAEVAGVDAVVGGHSHTLLGDMEDAEGPIDDGQGRRRDRGAGRDRARLWQYLGHLTLTWDDSGKLIKAEGRPILLDASVKPDEKIAARVKEMAAPIAELKQGRVADISAPIDGERVTCRARECEMGNVVAEAMLDRVKDQGHHHRHPEWRRVAGLDRSGAGDHG